MKSSSGLTKDMTEENYDDCTVTICTCPNPKQAIKRAKMESSGKYIEVEGCYDMHTGLENSFGVACDFDFDSSAPEGCYVEYERRNCGTEVKFMHSCLNDTEASERESEFCAKTVKQCEAAAREVSCLGK